jgi:hypothetical protein
MNAFHPEFMKTFYPGFWTTAAVEARKSEIMSEIVSNTRKTKPHHGTMFGINNKVTPVSLKPLEFMTYSRAGTANTTKKKKA